MIIVISGPAGSGKTSVASRLAKSLSFKLVSAGNLFREIAKEKDMDVISLNRVAESDFEIDKSVDRRIYEYLLSEKDLVIESHIAGWLFREYANVTIYLWAPLKVRATRISMRDNIPYNEALIQIIRREYMHYRRFKKFYGIDINNLSVFDLVINTNNMSLDNVVKVILTYLLSISSNSGSIKNEAK
ncbi:cytidylate kinase [Sulfolobus sp. E1]|nr:cytidylate kinase [Sulfolobus sp. E1]